MPKPQSTDQTPPAAGPAGNDMAFLPEPNKFLPTFIRVHNMLVTGFERACHIHIARWRLLYGVARAGEIVQADLAASTTIEPAAVTRIFSDMERRGLVNRQKSPDDARKLIVSLTPKGLAFVEEIALRRATFLDQALKGLSERDQATLETLLQKVEANLNAEKGS